MRLRSGNYLPLPDRSAVEEMSSLNNDILRNTDLNNQYQQGRSHSSEIHIGFEGSAHQICRSKKRCRKYVYETESDNDASALNRLEVDSDATFSTNGDMGMYDDHNDDFSIVSKRHCSSTSNNYQTSENLCNTVSKISELTTSDTEQYLQASPVNASGSLPCDVIDIDAADNEKPPYDPTYSSSIYSYKKSHEREVVHTKCIFENGTIAGSDITEGMRAILVDWLVSICGEYQVDSNTLFLSVHLLDSMLRIMPVRKAQFQLLGCGCFLVASKLAETHPPLMANLVELAAHCFTVDDLLEMEQRIANGLSFDLNLPTTEYFASRLLRTVKASERETSLVFMLLELSLMDYAFTQYKMSIVAASAVHLARQVLYPYSTQIWTPSLEYYSEYSEKDLVEVVMCLQRLHWNMHQEANELNAVHEKYDRTVKFRVSRITGIRESDLRFDYLNLPLDPLHQPVPSRTPELVNSATRLHVLDTKTHSYLEPASPRPGHNRKSAVTERKTSEPTAVVNGTNVDTPTDVYKLNAKLQVKEAHDPTYAKPIYLFKKKQEKSYIHQESVFTHGPNEESDITPSMRTTLVDWIVEISDSVLRMQKSTLFMAVHLVDSVLRVMTVKKTNFQLLGCACLLLATKMSGDDGRPLLADLVAWAAYCFTAEDLLEMEQRVAKLLSFDLNLPTIEYFASRLLLAADATEKESALVYMLIELALMDYKFTQYHMSLVAASAVYLARQVVRPQSTKIWTPTLEYFSEYSEKQLAEVVMYLQRLHWNMHQETNELKAVLRKYDRSSTLHVGSLPGIRSNDIKISNL